MTTSRRPVDELTTIGALTREAERVLLPDAWDYANAGAGEEVTVERNRSIFRSVAFVPRLLEPVDEVHTATRFFDLDLEVPILTAPIGSLEIFDPGSAGAAARGAQAAGAAAIVGMLSEPPFAVIQEETDGRNLFQLYVSGDTAWRDRVLDRVVHAGARALVVTVDSPVRARRDRLIDRGFDWRQETDGEPPNLRGLGRDRRFQAAFDLSALESLCGVSPIPVVVKGITTATDARRAVDVGAQAIYVSNHGGRELDHQQGALHGLAQVAAEVGGQVPIVFDSGIRRGTDVCKALALGADVVAIGRLQCWGLAVGGASGVEQVLRILQAEVSDVLALLGIGSVRELGRHHVEPVAHRPGEAAHAW
jgi:isopentenyl diphosphate isomerase/L-lactate dehydrogenase-like FMN-dependent dehydrogenase